MPLTSSDRRGKPYLVIGLRRDGSRVVLDEQPTPFEASKAATLFSRHLRETYTQLVVEKVVDTEAWK
jgi:hypothetical protein